jgi:hypothetical protein
MRRVPIIIGVTLIVIGAVITRSAMIKQAEQEIPRPTADRPVLIPAVDFSSIQNPIVPSPVIDTEAPIFLGAGDGSNGSFYPKRRATTRD